MALWDAAQNLFIDGNSPSKIKAEVDHAIEDVLEKVNDAAGAIADQEDQGVEFPT